MPGEAPPLESTVELIDRARHGEPQALEELMARHLDPLRRWVTGRLPRGARALSDTDDLVQDVLLRTLRTLGDFEVRGVGAFHAYLRQAVMNRLRDELRRKGRTPEFVGADELDLAAAGSPLEDAIGREALQRYCLALTRLRPEDREAVVARVEMNCSYADLAVMLDKPTADAARKATQRALLRLAEAMKP